MRQELAQAIYKADAEGQNHEIDLDEYYSGRGMFGKTTWAITVGSVNTFYVLLAIASAWMKEDNKELWEDIFLDWLPIKQDNMGGSYIFY
jgi:hypothetical protein